MKDRSQQVGARGRRDPFDNARVALRRYLAALIAAGALAGVMAVASPAQAVSAEQVRYAEETMMLGNWQFAERKADFLAAGCGSIDQCEKPVPYHQFDWDTDSCSGPVPESLRNLFHPACQQHDFGYRNFGKGLTLGRDEGTRRWIDDRMQAEMKDICNYRFSDWLQYANLQVCFKEAEAMWLAVRLASDWSEPLDQTFAESADDSPPASKTIFPQTTGTGTHTWTNPANAGGTPGPVIPAGTTVGVACRVDGFPVANGNSAWYLIASSPSDNTYWASADAFSNNGDTSGGLRGTPYFDDDVPYC
ncbi:phospholipase A2 [Micromonospora sp. NPDC051196]|uniref:phospholipase A2 n=1 Tax=Micromonospora sp. NPDC051196 TaxID=3155281 RepID=UPI0034354C14